MTRPARTRPHPAAVVVLVAAVWVVVVAVATSDLHGTGAREVGAVAQAAGGTSGTGASGCVPTRTNPGGSNNYRPRAPVRPVLGHGFVVSGTVRGPDCRPLPGVRVQVWAQTATASETVNRGSVRTGPDGTFRLESDPVRSQFGEPNVHVGVDENDDPWRQVLLRTVIDPDDTAAVVDLVLEPDR